MDTLSPQARQACTELAHAVHNANERALPRNERIASAVLADLIGCNNHSGARLEPRNPDQVIRAAQAIAENPDFLALESKKTLAASDVRTLEGQLSVRRVETRPTPRVETRPTPRHFSNSPSNQDRYVQSPRIPCDREEFGGKNYRAQIACEDYNLKKDNYAMEREIMERNSLERDRLNQARLDEFRLEQDRFLREMGLRDRLESSSRTFRSAERHYSNFVQNEIDRAGVTSREDAQAITRALAVTSPTSEELLNRERANQQPSSGRER